MRQEGDEPQACVRYLGHQNHGRHLHLHLLKRSPDRVQVFGERALGVIRNPPCRLDRKLSYRDQGEVWVQRFQVGQKLGVQFLRACQPGYLNGPAHLHQTSGRGQGQVRLAKMPKVQCLDREIGGHRVDERQQRAPLSAEAEAAVDARIVTRQL